MKTIAFSVLLLLLAFGAPAQTRRPPPVLTGIRDLQGQSFVVLEPSDGPDG
jgi:hypothetical protein